MCPQIDRTPGPRPAQCSGVDVRGCARCAGRRSGGRWHLRESVPTRRTHEPPRSPNERNEHDFQQSGLVRASDFDSCGSRPRPGLRSPAPRRSSTGPTTAAQRSGAPPSTARGRTRALSPAPVTPAGWRSTRRTSTGPTMSAAGRSGAPTSPARA